MNNNSMDVDRRRKGSGPVGRADAPQRESGGGQGGGFPPSGGNRPMFGGMPSRGGQIGGCGTLVILLLIVGYYLLTGGQGISSNPSSDQPSNPVDFGYLTEAPALPASNFTPPVPAVGDQTWTVMLYQDADDQVLEQDVYLDLNEAERVGSSDNVRIVAQIDRYRAGFQGDGNWTSTRRYYVTQDSDLDVIARVPSPLSRDRARRLHAGLAVLPLRVDVQLETPAGAVALAEYAGAGARVVLRTRAGPRWVANPWEAAGAP